MHSLFQEPDPPPAEKSAETARAVPVLVPYPVDKAYSYAVPPGMELAPGDYVTVPLGSREVPGIVWDPAADGRVAGAGAEKSSEKSSEQLSEREDQKGPEKRRRLKSIVARYDVPPLPAVHRRFIEWVAHYNMAPLGFVLKMALPVPGALEPPKPVTGYVVADWAREILRPRGGDGPAAGHGGGEGDEDRDAGEGAAPPERDRLLRNLSPQRRRVLDALADGIPRRAAEIAALAGCGAGVVRAMEGLQLLRAVDMVGAAPCRRPDWSRPRAALAQAQAGAAAHLSAHVREGGYHASLLDGVTGAGKTEIYFEAVAEALKAGKQALLLLPEIALSNAFMERFRARFGCAPALWHSGLTPVQRRNAWRGVAEGQTKVVVGARSALFLPYADLGLIVVDEEHDPAYKQEDGVIYNARDMAVVRASLGKIPVVLVSATPSLETMANAWAGRYEHLHLPDRYGGARLPDVTLVDMRKDKPPRPFFISPVLQEALRRNLEAGEQSLLFLNRRGYAPLTLCRACGHRLSCPRCTAWLVEHRRTGRLHCHHCGYGVSLPEKCPSCGEADSLTACGPGVERIREEVTHDFPDARIVVLASDTAETPEELRRVLEDIRTHQYDIVIGTQIIAKGHHFPMLTLVGVVDADLGLSGGDLRAAERTFQLLHQVSGRAGREERPGRVYMQTFFPDNKVMQALAGHERDYFLDVEAHEREQAQMPPYSRLVGIIVSGKDEKLVMDTAQALGRAAPEGPGLLTLGPAEAPFYRLRGNYRRRLLVRADKTLNIQKAIADWMAQVKVPSTVRVYIDIDPQSFL